MKWILHLLVLCAISTSLLLTQPALAEPEDTTATPQVININTASLEELTELKGIGKAKAMAIIEYRQTHGEFQRIEQLLEVKGIGQSTLNKNSQLIAFE